jgi:hypothetical protein
VLVLRAFFEWLAAVRYLGGNPWLTVNDPVTDQKEMHIDKALPQQLWVTLTEEGGVLDPGCVRATPSRLLAARCCPKRRPLPVRKAAILLMGFTCLRREEAANGTHNRLKPVRGTAGSKKPLWELAVRGKRNKWRTVFFAGRMVDALRAHWADRG